jgi:hypothetical protein
MAEGGIFSPNRKYLRIRYEDLTYDVSAILYGKCGFFLSSRLSRVNVWRLIAKYVVLIACLSLLGMLFRCFCGWYGVAVVFLLFAGAIRSFRREASGATFRGLLTEMLSHTPIVGSIYHNLLHPHTMYSEDSRRAFQQTVHHSLLRTLDGLTTRKASLSHEPPRTFNLFGR